MLTDSQKIRTAKISRHLLFQSICIMAIAGFVTAAYRIPTSVTIGGVATPTAGHQVAQKIITPSDTEWAYLISLPPTYDPNGSKLWPTIVFYGPACDMYGSSGTISCFFTVNFDNGGPAKYCQDSVRSKYPFIADRFIVISPYITDRLNSNNGDPKRAKNLHTYLLSHYKIDPAKVTLLGFCAGGGVIWNYSEFDPTFATCMVPISCNDSWCSTCNLTLACNLKNIWIRHYAADKDGMVPYANQVAMHTALNNCALTPRRDSLITLSSGSHEIWLWSGIANTAPVYDWMLTKTGTTTAIVPETDGNTNFKSTDNQLRVLDTRLLQNDRMEIINSNGRIMYSSFGNGTIVNQMIPTLARGLYMVRINHNSQTDAQIILSK